MIKSNLHIVYSSLHVYYYVHTTYYVYIIRIEVLNEASRGAGAQACDYKRQVVGSVPTRGNEIFNILISSLW